MKNDEVLSNVYSLLTKEISKDVLPTIIYLATTKDSNFTDLITRGNRKDLIIMLWQIFKASPEFRELIEEALLINNITQKIISGELSMKEAVINFYKFKSNE